MLRMPTREESHHLGKIAMYIGAALNHPMPECNGKGLISTIEVHQYKQKFNEIRIYCTLASPRLVTDMWVGDNIHDSRDITDAFIEQCFDHDARHYRYVYLSMVDLTPADADSILCSADYRELLCKDTKALDEFIDKIEYFDFYRQRYSSFHVVTEAK